MKMDSHNEEITGVSLNFVNKCYHIKQSGVLINDFIITTGGLLVQYVLSKKIKDINEVNIEISLEKNGRVVLLSGFIACVCYSDDLNNSLTKNYFGLDSITIQAFSYFLFIRISNTVIGNFTKVQLMLDPTVLYKGQDVLTVSTPFGTEKFLNCYSKGIISKVVDKAMFITDSRLSTGCEGGPIYIFTGPIKLVGLVLTQLKISGECTGFNLCCYFYLLYEAYCRYRGLPIVPSIPSIIKEENPIHRVSNCILPIKTHTMRGSCISLNKNGLLVTCSHVINYGNDAPVEVTFCGKSYTANVLCYSSKDDILDLAFLQINADTQLPCCTFYDRKPIKGEPVFLIGYKYLRDNYLQLVSKGTVLKHEEQGPIYTSCLTHSGNSGGGMFGEDGKLMAIICGILFEKNLRKPHNCHNAGIPIEVMKKPIDAYLQTGDLSHLVSLCKKKDLNLPKWHFFTNSKL